jgi:mannose-6-phosphate isomerase-like protein (cupin superfamily)
MADPDVTYARLNPDFGERFQPLRRELDLGTFGLNLITMRPRERGRIHAHERQHEVYIVLEGRLTLMLEGTERVLGPWEAARVGPTVRRQLVNAGRERLILLAIGAAGEHQGRDGCAWTSWDERGEGRAPQEIPLPEDLPAS